jgi:type I restriction enzyme R subunit
MLRALTSHADLAEHVMKHDQQAIGPLIALVYDLIKSGGDIDMSMTDI